MKSIFTTELNQKYLKTEDFFTRQSFSENLGLAYFLADFIERKKNQTAANMLELAISILRYNMTKYPHKIESHLLLARLFLWVNELEEAILICDRILTLKGFDYLALHVRGIARLQSGNIRGSINDLAVLNKLNPYHGLLAWNLANAYFFEGKHKEGWDVFSIANSILPNTYPEIPYWSGEDIIGKNVILTQYNSNGGGDDLLYAQMIPDIIAQTNKCFIEVEPRAEKLYRQSFKNGHIFQVGETPWIDSTSISFQVIVPTLGSLLRTNLGDFERPAGYLKCNKSDAANWEKKMLTIAGDTLKVGICWRSLISIGLTGPLSTRIEDWADILQVPGVTFFELQYDDSEQERLDAEKLFKVKIHRLQNIDLMKEFDQIAAISVAMDLIISPVTTIGIIANAAGAKVWELRPHPTALCMSGLPWFPNRTIFTRTDKQTWKQVLGKVAIKLKICGNQNNAR
jgi:tetratricopeptide (TPR) repeat protein